jgi:hypothetical protein
MACGDLGRGYNDAEQFLAARELEERFLDCAARLVRTSERERKAALFRSK